MAVQRRVCIDLYFFFTGMKKLFLFLTLENLYQHLVLDLK